MQKNKLSFLKQNHEFSKLIIDSEPEDIQTKPLLLLILCICYFLLTLLVTMLMIPLWPLFICTSLIYGRNPSQIRFSEMKRFLILIWTVHPNPDVPLLKRIYYTITVCSFGVCIPLRSGSLVTPTHIHTYTHLSNLTPTPHFLALSLDETQYCDLSLSLSLSLLGRWLGPWMKRCITLSSRTLKSSIRSSRSQQCVPEVHQNTSKTCASTTTSRMYIFSVCVCVCVCVCIGTQIAHYLEQSDIIAAPNSLQMMFPYLWLWKLCVHLNVLNYIPNDFIEFKILRKFINSRGFFQRHEMELFMTDTIEVKSILKY